MHHISQPSFFLIFV